MPVMYFFFVLCWVVAFSVYIPKICENLVNFKLTYIFWFYPKNWLINDTGIVEQNKSSLTFNCFKRMKNTRFALLLFVYYSFTTVRRVIKSKTITRFNCFYYNYNPNVNFRNVLFMSVILRFVERTSLLRKNGK